jgi:hypothetical protein
MIRLGAVIRTRFEIDPMMLSASNVLYRMTNNWRRSLDGLPQCRTRESSAEEMLRENIYVYLLRTFLLPIADRRHRRLSLFVRRRSLEKEIKKNVCIVCCCWASNSIRWSALRSSRRSLMLGPLLICGVLRNIKSRFSQIIIQFSALGRVRDQRRTEETTNKHILFK